MKKTAAFVIIVLTVLVVRIFILEPKINPSGAMAPTILAGDYLLVYKWPYGHFRLAGLNFGGARDFIGKDKITRGDIITFRYPEKPSVEFVKRVVGLPGDKLSYSEKKLVVNGEVIRAIYDANADYVDRVLGKLKVKRYSEAINNKSYYIQLTGSKNLPSTEIKKTVTVPDGFYFVLGDNRDLSNDSRHFGFVSAKAITGKVAGVYYSYDKIRKSVRWMRIGLLLE